MRLFPWRRRPRQTCWAFCPHCGMDLVSQPDALLSDTDLVRYRCGSCGLDSTWNFDACPVPVLVRAA